MRTFLSYLAPAWLVIAGALNAGPSFAGSAAQLDRDATAALESLYQQVPDAKKFGQTAKGILVFPKVIKAGLIVGAQGGEGALRVDGKTKGYYQSASLSVGLQAGAQWFGYAMFFQNEEALGFLDRSDGWEIGSGPSITVVDQGFARSLSSTTLKDDIYVFFFDQKGLMAGLGLQGTKISKWKPEE